MAQNLTQDGSLIEGVLLEPLVRLVGALGVRIVDEVVRRSIRVVGTHICHDSADS